MVKILAPLRPFKNLVHQFQVGTAGLQNPPPSPQKLEMLTQYGQNFGPLPLCPFLKVGHFLFTGLKLEPFQL